MGTLDLLAGPRLRKGRGSVFGRILAAVLAADAAYRQRHALSQLSPHLLKDVGLSDGERARAIGVWDAPTVMRGR